MLLKKKDDGQKGKEQIEKALGSFAGLITDLEDGKALVDAQEEKNTAEVERLLEENKTLKTSASQATQLASNLRAMTSGKLLVAAAEDVQEEKTPETE